MVGTRAFDFWSKSTLFAKISVADKWSKVVKNAPHPIALSRSERRCFTTMKEPRRPAPSQGIQKRVLLAKRATLIEEQKNRQNTSYHLLKPYLCLARRQVRQKVSGSDSAVEKG